MHASLLITELKFIIYSKKCIISKNNGDGFGIQDHSLYITHPYKLKYNSKRK